MDSYLKKIKLFVNDEIYDRVSFCVLKEKEEVEDSEYICNKWEDIPNFEQRWHSSVGIASDETKKGLKVYCGDGFSYGMKTFKSWKDNCPSLKVTVTFEPTSVTMAELMKFDSEKVIKYLKERGITSVACPLI